MFGENYSARLGQCNTGLAKIDVKELIYKATSAVVLITKRNKRNTCEASNTLWF